ncbi:MAG: hypothetical protein MHPSP_001270, partial [Paramarteilia canceri]
MEIESEKRGKMLGKNRIIDDLCLNDQSKIVDILADITSNLIAENCELRRVLQSPQSLEINKSNGIEASSSENKNKKYFKDLIHKYPFSVSDKFKSILSILKSTSKESRDSNMNPFVLYDELIDSSVIEMKAKLNVAELEYELDKLRKK